MNPDTAAHVINKPEKPKRTVELITFREASRRLSVSPKWLRRNRDLPFIRILGPRMFRVDVAAMERWIERQRVR